jgi:hypothetical protein
MYGLIFVLALGNRAEFLVTVDASRHSEWRIVMNGQEIRPGRFRSEVLYSEVEVEFEIHFVDGGEWVTHRLRSTLVPGERCRFNFVIPRVYPTVAICRN